MGELIQLRVRRADMWVICGFTEIYTLFADSFKAHESRATSF